jgi:FixJ family two-component response regulator
VYVVDDDPSFLRAVSRRLGAAGFQVEAFESAEAFLSSRRGSPGCVVLDLRMPDVGGLEVQEALLRSDEPMPVIFLTGHGDVHGSVRAMKRGAVDFLTKPVNGEELIAAVTRAIAIDAQSRDERSALRDLRSRYARLTPREREVCALVAKGWMNKQIAAQLGTTERTIKAHRAQVMTKMALQSVADLVLAIERLSNA